MTLSPRMCSVHTHSTLCDGKASPEAMAAAAYAAGVRYFGVSCHSHTPIPDDEGAVLPADMTDYRAAVLALREQYAGRMEVLLGLEWDSQSDISPDGFDYWIGSVHYQRAPDGAYYAADWGEAQFSACRDRMYGGDALAVAEGYFRNVARVAAMRPTILGHLDLITKLNAGNRFFDEDTPRYRSAALDALHAAVLPCLKSTPAASPADTVPRPIRRCFSSGSGAIWADGSFSPPMPTVRILWSLDMIRLRNWPRPRGSPAAVC